jgi:hypothetical protein
MTEQVYRVVQIGVESTPGTGVAATTQLALDAAVPALERGSQFGGEDYGRSIRNHAGRGYHGLRASSMPFSCDVNFEQVMYLLEMFMAGGIVPTGTNPYTWVYVMEGGANTQKTYTIEEGVVGSTQDEWEMVGSMVDDLTIEYDALAAPGAQPWRASGTFVGFNRAVATMTPALTLPALETAMGHLTILKEGTTATAFASLTELAASLIRFSLAMNRNRVRRVYGSTSDVATGWGLSEKATGAFEAMVKINATSKTDTLDIWNAAGGALGERRWRVEAVGSGTKKLDVDLRTGFTEVGIDTRDGERVYAVKGEIVDDSTLTGPTAITVVNSVATLT